MTHDNADQGKSIRSRFPLRMWDITKLALSATSFPFTRADSRHEARSFTSCSTRQRNALPLSPALFESRRSIPARGTCALRYLRDTSISGPRLGRVLSSTWPRASPATHEITGRPFLFPTWGSSVSARPRLAPHPRGHRLRGPGGDKEPDACLRPPVSTLDDGRLPLSPPGLPITHLLLPRRRRPLTAEVPLPAAAVLFPMWSRSLWSWRVQTPPKRLHPCHHFRLWRRWRSACRGVGPRGTGRSPEERGRASGGVLRWLGRPCAPASLPPWGPAGVEVVRDLRRILSWGPSFSKLSSACASLGL